MIFQLIVLLPEKRKKGKGKKEGLGKERYAGRRFNRSNERFETQTSPRREEIQAVVRKVRFRILFVWTLEGNVSFRQGEEFESKAESSRFD